MPRLTAGQSEWLEFLDSLPTGMLSRMNIEVGSGASIASLIKGGLAEWRKNRSFLCITDAGRRALIERSSK